MGRVLSDRDLTARPAPSRAAPCYRRTVNGRWSGPGSERRSAARAALGAGALAALALSPLLSLDCASGLWGAKALDASTTEGATAASNAFGFDLYARLKHDGDNLICSPLSASVALNMASAGARGATRAEMLSVLHVDPQRAAETHASFGGLLAAINGRDGTGGVILHVADQLWGQSGFRFNRDFLGLLRDSYRAPLETVDFEHAPGDAATAINQLGRRADARPHPQDRQ